MDGCGMERPGAGDEPLPAWSVQGDDHTMVFLAKTDF
jgi:hypothetical protein